MLVTGFTAMALGAEPTPGVATTVFVAPSITETLLPPLTPP